MIKSHAALEALRIREDRVAYEAAGYEGAVDTFMLLWNEALLLNPAAGDDWLDDIQCDIAVARTLNARSRTD
jgi:hypothetical protein